MGALPTSLFRSWVHSFEEDTEGVTVYRPEDHPFPPARGRGGIEFAPDGVFVNHPMGRGDTMDTVPGRWSLVGGRRLVISYPRGDHRERELEIVHCDDRTLRIHWLPA